VWWCTPVIPALRRQRQQNCEFEASLGLYRETCLKKRKKEKELIFLINSYFLMESSSPTLIPTE
jgi:hypothetical protein